MQVPTQDDAVLDDGLADELDAAGAEDLCAAGDFIAAVLSELLAFLQFGSFCILRI